jgi:hypothetical protein
MNNGHQEDLACSIILKLLESCGATRHPPLLAFVLPSRKSAARPSHRPHVPDHSPSYRIETDPVMDFLKTNFLNVAEHCHQTILSENGQATF